MCRQESIECKTIWVVTPDPTTRASAANAHKIVEGKLKQKVEYTFIIPASKENAFSRFLSSYFSDYHDQISITSIDDKEYDTLAATTYVLIDTFSKNEKVYFEIPVKPSDNWIEVEDFAAHKFALRFQEYAKKAHKLNCWLTCWKL